MQLCRSRATRDVTRGRSYTETRSDWICMPFVGGKRGPTASRAVKLRRNNNKAQIEWTLYQLGTVVAKLYDDKSQRFISSTSSGTVSGGLRYHWYLSAVISWALISDVKDKPISPGAGDLDRSIVERHSGGRATAPQHTFRLAPLTGPSVVGHSKGSSPGKILRAACLPLTGRTPPPHRLHQARRGIYACR